MRTDIYKPSSIVPSEYEFVAFDYIKVESLGDCYVLKSEREAKAAHFARTGGRYSQHEHGGNCMICGNVNAVYTVTFYHSLTNTYIRVGHDCAEKLEMAEGDFDAFHKGIRNALEAQAGKRKAQATLEAAGLMGAWAIFTAESRDGFQYEEVTITDMVAKLVRYGSMSEKQQKYIGVLLQKIETRAQRAAQYAAEHDAAAEAPEGRMEVIGTVLKSEWRDSLYGSQFKMLVKSDAGWLCWSTVPAVLGDVKRGDKVTFTATLERSKDDSKFCFAKRPTAKPAVEQSMVATA